MSALIAEYLQQFGFAVTIEPRGDTAVARILNDQPDLVVLDLMLPGLDGMDVCREVRMRYTRPILMLTARDEDIDQVVGLELGADDYVTKPVKPRVLLARIRTLLRRQPASLSDQVSEKTIVIGAFSICQMTREATLDTQPLKLTTQEFDLLWLLADNAGNVLSRDDILAALSGAEYDGLDRSVDIRIARLRKLLGDPPAAPRYIKTVRGRGYLFVKQVGESI